ncbi:MAG: protein kinase [Crocinitomicaceae bacterium]|jgi:serine/threonine protein kinase|nr:protein kinase [Crocinitomicaceae bacterium]
MEVWKENFTLVRQLSRTQSKRFGQSFLLQEKSSKKLVVFKLIDKSNSIGYQQLKNENIFTLSQKGLPEILGSFENETQFGIYKKYEEGETFDLFWKGVKRSKRKEKLEVVINNLQPLFQHLEEQNITHADIKPENIIVQEKNGKLDCALIDFGLAFDRTDLPNRKTLFQLGYASPELILNRLDCTDPSTDIFSLCLVIYKLWSGKLPLSSPNPAMMTQLQITYPIEKAWKIPKSLWKVLEKGLAKHRFKLPANKMTKQEVSIALKEANKKRYGNFSDFQKAINSI